MDWWIWVIVGFVLLLVEVLTPGALFALFFGFGAIITGLLTAAGLGGVFEFQVTLFLLFSIGLLLAFRKKLLSTGVLNSSSRKVDSLVGEIATMNQDLAPGEVGKAQLRGTVWNVKNGGTAPITRSSRAKVEAVDGLTLLVRGE